MKDAIERALDNQEVQHWLSMFHFTALTYATSEFFHHPDVVQWDARYTMFALAWVLGITVDVLRRGTYKPKRV